MMECYLDNSATTRVDEEVATLINKIMLEDYGNPSSLHSKGFEAEKYIREAKKTFADLLTIYREKGTFENLTIGLCGDLKFGRTVHSLINAMCRYTGNKFVLISPNELKLPSYVKKDVLKERGIPYVQTTSLEEVMPDLDVLYMTRVQRERFFNEEDYLRLKDTYVLDMKKLARAKDDLCIMHPLPRVNEISVAVDDDPRACYFKQVLNGKYMRMALILKLLKEAGTI